MNAQNTLQAITFVLASALFGGCLEIETTTTLHTDGRLGRTIVIKGDSASIYAGPYTIPIDSTWSREIRKLEERKFELTARKEFANAQELSDQLQGVPGRSLGFTVSVEESFRWFTTVITYRETLHRFQPIDEVPVSDFISQSEIDRFIQHEVLKEPYATTGDSLSLEDAGDRYEEWNKRNVFAAYYRIFLEGIRKLNDPSLTEAYLESHKDTLFSAFSAIEEHQPDKARRVFESLLKKKAAVDQVYRLQEGKYRTFDEGSAFVNEVTTNTYSNSVVMPGLILDTNAPTLEGNRASWNDYTNVAFVQDFDMWVVSQVINWWAIVLTGVIVLGGLGLLIIAAIRRKQNGMA
jgi:hypothetical protein